MSDTDRKDHRELAQAIRQRLAAAQVDTDAVLRTGAAARAAGGEPIPEPYDALARLVGEASYRVTDKEVAAVRDATGSDKATFEIVMAAAIGAGLSRWDHAIRALDEASDASR
jgi:hypothetical protein